MVRRSSGVTVKREVFDRNFPDVPPGFSAADSIPVTVKHEVDGDGGSLVDDLDHLPLKKRMRMLPVGGPSGSLSGTESSGTVPTCCVDAVVIEEARPSKASSSRARSRRSGDLTDIDDAAAVADPPYICSENGARMNDPFRPSMPRRCKGESGPSSTHSDDPCFIPQGGCHLSDYARDGQAPNNLKGRGIRTGWNEWFVGAQPQFDQVLERTPLSGLFQVRLGQANLALLTVLVERWRAETHTFQLPFGEWSITPFDAFIQTGLRYEGRSLPFEDDLPLPTEEQWVRWLGMAPPPSEFQGLCLKLRWLSTNFASRNPQTEEEAVQKARALILYTLGALLFNHGNERVSSRLLSLVADITFPIQYNWNAALLAHLYEGLDKASRRESKSLIGFFPLIEACFYDHFSHLAPPLKNCSPPAARMMLWHQDNRNRSRKHSDLAWRSNIDSLVWSDFVPRPYLRSAASRAPGAQAAFQASRCRCILKDPQATKWYLGERLYWQLTGCPLVPHRPPMEPANWANIPEFSAALEGIDADAFVDKQRDYDAWYAKFGVGPFLHDAYAPGGGARFAGGRVLAPHVEKAREVGEDPYNQE